MINSIVCEFCFNFFKSKMIPSFSPLKPLHCLSPGSQPSRSPEMEKEALRVPRAHPEPREEECTFSGSASLLLLCTASDLDPSRRGGTSGQFFWGVGTFLSLQTGTQVPLVSLTHTYTWVSPHLHIPAPHHCLPHHIQYFMFLLPPDTHVAVHCTQTCALKQMQRPHPRGWMHACRVLASSTPGCAPRPIHCHSTILQKLEEDDRCLCCCLATFTLWSAWQLHCAHKCAWVCVPTGAWVQDSGVRSFCSGTACPELCSIGFLICIPHPTLLLSMASPPISCLHHLLQENIQDSHSPLLAATRSTLQR